MNKLEKIKLEKESKIVKPSIYFGHPVSTYNKDIESISIKNISLAFPCFNVYNPNNIEDANNYKYWRENSVSGMQYYFDVVLPNMHSGIFLPFNDNKYGAGVWSEAKFLQDSGKNIYSINESELISKINDISNEEVLSIEETRERVYG